MNFQPILEQLEPFSFSVVTLQRQSRLFQRDQWDMHRHQQPAYRFTEQLPGGISLEMVSIPESSTLSPFYLGRYPVTQGQWRAVADLPPCERMLDPEPAYFKGDLRPVEQVSWVDAFEFCARLCAYTGRNYRLPTSAEWEYACRAGTTTPFHFGDMIISEVANYDGSAYANGPTSKARDETTPVDYFDCANIFGLSDMHGNVSEWCEDSLQDEYFVEAVIEANDGSNDWFIHNEENAGRAACGGNWAFTSQQCSSASCIHYHCSLRLYYVGFRVALSPLEIGDNPE